MATKKVYRDTTNKILAGVCSGIAKHIGLDPLLIRIAWAVLTVCTLGIGGVAAYIVCILLIPVDPGYIDV